MAEESQHGLRKVAPFSRAEANFVNTIGMNIMALADLKSN